jgi:hypothetical protein
MLGFLVDEGKLTDRKRRLFACACCRRIWQLLTDERSRNAIEVAERWADALVSDDEAKHALEAAHQARRDFRRDNPDPDSDAFQKGHCGCWAACYIDFRDWSSHEVAMVMTLEKVGSDPHVAIADEKRQQFVLFRDIIGNPFQPLTLDPAWLTPTVTSLAAAAYEERDLPIGHLDSARLGVLADALEDAGCDDAELLGHLRGPGPHVRGCWALDLLLGRS